MLEAATGVVVRMHEQAGNITVNPHQLRR
jgi:hypothetical protein